MKGRWQRGSKQAYAIVFIVRDSGLLRVSKTAAQSYCRVRWQRYRRRSISAPFETKHQGRVVDQGGVVDHTVRLGPNYALGLGLGG